MRDLRLRRLDAGDRPRIIEISSQIWDGHDDVPDQLDAWIDDACGEALGAVLEGGLVGFARRTWLSPGLSRLEGIRTDPVFRGRGVGRVLTEVLIAGARAAGVARLATRLGGSDRGRHTGLLCIRQSPGELAGGHPQLPRWGDGGDGIAVASGPCPPSERRDRGDGAVLSRTGSGCQIAAHRRRVPNMDERNAGRVRLRVGRAPNDVAPRRPGCSARIVATRTKEDPRWTTEETR